MSSLAQVVILRSGEDHGSTWTVVAAVFAVVLALLVTGLGLRLSDRRRGAGNTSATTGRKKRRVAGLAVGLVLIGGAGAWLLSSGPAWLALVAATGVVLVAFTAPRWDDGSPPEGRWASGGPGGF